jgi:hypothetical protein
LACQDEFFVNNLLDVKDNDEHAPDVALHFSLEGLLHCLTVITINPAFITSDNPRQVGCIIRGNLIKLADDMPLLLMKCQKSHQAR